MLSNAWQVLIQAQNKDLPDDHPSTAIDFCHLFGQRTEVLSTYAHKTSDSARANERLHMSALKDGRRQSAAVKLLLSRK